MARREDMERHNSSKLRVFEIWIKMERNCKVWFRCIDKCDKCQKIDRGRHQDRQRKTSRQKEEDIKTKTARPKERHWNDYRHLLFSLPVKRSRRIRATAATPWERRRDHPSLLLPRDKKAALPSHPDPNRRPGEPKRRQGDSEATDRQSGRRMDGQLTCALWSITAKNTDCTGCFPATDFYKIDIIQ